MIRVAFCIGLCFSDQAKLFYQIPEIVDGGGNA